MAGRPAARITDNVLHLIPGILIPGPPSPNVIIGGLPAWKGLPLGSAGGLLAAKAASDVRIKTAQAATLAAAGTPGLPAAKAAEETLKATEAAAMSATMTSASGGASIHMCVHAAPVPVPPPHGPGLVIDGSPTVLINGLPACRLGDTILEAFGPPDKIIKGEFTVLIGNGAGGGGGGGGMPGAPGALGAPSEFADSGVAGATGGAKSPGPKWTKEDIIAEWKKSEKGKEILSKLPPDTEFKSYKKKPGESRNAYYSMKENAIYIPEEYTSVEAAPTAAHEAVHADQVVNGKRPKSNTDLVEMEVEAKNAGLQVYEDLGRPSVPYNYKDEADMRKKNPKAYDELVRKHYKKLYKVK